VHKLWTGRARIRLAWVKSLWFSACIPTKRTPGRLTSPLRGTVGMRGQTMVEYALIIAAVSAVAWGAYNTMGHRHWLDGERHRFSPDQLPDPSHPSSSFESRRLDEAQRSKANGKSNDAENQSPNPNRLRTVRISARCQRRLNTDPLFAVGRRSKTDPPQRLSDQGECEGDLPLAALSSAWRSCPEQRARQPCACP
jgi:hypothetical protein